MEAPSGFKIGRERWLPVHRDAATAYLPSFTFVYWGVQQSKKKRTSILDNTTMDTSAVRVNGKTLSSVIGLSALLFVRLTVDALAYQRACAPCGESFEHRRGISTVGNLGQAASKTLRFTVPQERVSV